MYYFYFSKLNPEKEKDATEEVENESISGDENNVDENNGEEYIDEEESDSMIPNDDFDEDVAANFLNGELEMSNELGDDIVNPTSSDKESDDVEEGKPVKKIPTFEDGLARLSISNEEFNSKSYKEKQVILKKIDKMVRFAARKIEKRDKGKTNAVTGNKRQTFLFSATLGMLETGRFQARKDGKAYIPKKNAKDRLSIMLYKFN